MRCYCDCDENIENYDVEDLLKEIANQMNLRTRGNHSQGVRLILADDIAAIQRAVKKGDLMEAEYLLNTTPFAKWVDPVIMQDAYRKAMMPPPPPPRNGLWFYSV